MNKSNNNKVNMKIKSDMIFLVPGHLGSENTKVEHRVVVAKSSDDVIALLAKKSPDFLPLGITSLKEFQDTEAKIRLSLKGAGEGWPLIIDENLK